MPRKFKYFVRIFKTDSDIVDKAFKKAVKEVYNGEENVPFGTSIEINEWKGIPQIEILGAGEDERCAFCNYFRKAVGEENTKRNNCPFA